MKRSRTILALAPVVLAAGPFLVFGASASDAAAPAVVAYEVTLTNLTAHQVIAAPLVATHDGGVRMFVPGGVAGSELQALAEDGDHGPLQAVLLADPGVLDVVAFPADLPPGDSATVVVTMDPGHARLSLAGMLVTTNDAFVGADSLTAPLRTREEVFLLPAYDAGTEANSESCTFIPGPPCGNGGVHDPAPAEGFVHVSSGIHGQGDLAAEVYDWGAFAARMEVRRL